MEKTLGLYLHIPFCKSKCAYCDFYSLPHSEEKMDAYTAALIRHLEEVAPRCTAHTVDTVYFGGGTPSYLGEKRLIKLLKTVKKRYHVAADAEITLEANPDSAEDWKTLRALRKAGFNRISLGAQAADDELLRRIGRVHTWEQVLSAVAAARMAGLENLSLDLIYGLPGQSLAAWQDTLRSAAALEPKHISCYGLKIEPGTPLWQQRQSTDIPDDDTQADMYLWTVDYLKKHGYEQYEISNFAQPGYESRHNLKYWTLGEYAGFGPGAHSDMGGVRFAYERDLDAYIAGDLHLSELEEIPPLDRDLEYIMLSLRTTRGIDSGYFERQFRQKFQPMEELLVQYEAHGFAVRTEKGWCLTPRGFFVSNTIIVSLQEAVGRARQQKLQRAAEGDFKIDV